MEWFSLYLLGSVAIVANALTKAWDDLVVYRGRDCLNARRKRRGVVSIGGVAGRITIAKQQSNK